MYDRIVLPLDGSPSAARAIVPAQVLAEADDAPIVAVSCTPPGDHASRRRSLVRSQLDDHGAQDAELRVPVAPGPVAPVLAELLEEGPRSLVVMASVGRPHSAAIIGSVSEELLHRTTGPVLLVGPHVDTAAFALQGPLVVPVDGSRTSEAALPLATAWAVRFSLQPWVVEVVDRRSSRAALLAQGADGPLESSYVHRLAAHLAEQAGVEADFEVLHSEHPATAIVEDARERGAAVIVMSTHGRTGARRLALGSVAISVVHHAHSPVLVTCPPHTVP